MSNDQAMQDMNVLMGKSSVRTIQQAFHALQAGNRVSYELYTRTSYKTRDWHPMDYLSKDDYNKFCEDVKQYRAESRPYHNARWVLKPVMDEMWCRRKSNGHIGVARNCMTKIEIWTLGYVDNKKQYLFLRPEEFFAEWEFLRTEELDSYLKSVWEVSDIKDLTWFQLREILSKAQHIENKYEQYIWCIWATKHHFSNVSWSPLPSWWWYSVKQLMENPDYQKYAREMFEKSLTLIG
jgi:hypothetical protein